MVKLGPKLNRDWIDILLCEESLERHDITDSPAAKGGNPKISDIVLCSTD